MTWLSANKALAYGAAAVALIVAALLILLVFRLAFGRRLRMPGGRGRQLRLGIVDAFDLDRQRQLVIVRRDNVEHLVMIGGPNDVLIESEIVRAEAREGRQRDKDHKEREKGRPEPVQLTPSQVGKIPAAEPQLPLPPFVPTVDDAPLPPRAAPTAPAPRQSPSAPAQTIARAAPQPPSVPRRMPPLRPENTLTETPAASAIRTSEPPPAPEPASMAEAPAVPPLPTAATPSSGPARWRPTQPANTSLSRPAGPALPPRKASPAEPNAAMTPPPGAIADNKSASQISETWPKPDAAPTPIDAEDLMLSLEEEMAKLLGRTGDK